jgi:hypothetical protein
MEVDNGIRRTYCHVRGVSVTNNNGFWIGWLDLLTLLLQSLLITIKYSAIANLPTSEITRTGSILVLVLCWTLLSLYSQLNSQLSLTLILRPTISRLVLESSTLLGLTSRSLLLSDSCGFLIWGALSDERTGLLFTIAAGPRQRSHFRVRVP